MIVFDPSTWTIAPKHVYVLKDNPNTNQMAGTIVRMGFNTSPYRLGDRVIWRSNSAITCGSFTHVILNIDDIGAYQR